MAKHQVPAQLRTHRQRAFQIEFLPHFPGCDVGQRQGFGGRFHFKPVAIGSVVLGCHRVADARAGNRSPDVEAIRIVGGTDPRPHSGRDLVDSEDLAEVGHNSGEHVRLRAV